MVKIKDRKFVVADPGKCTGCSLCEYVCALEKKENIWTPLRSRIRIIRLTSAFNIALVCRFCEDSPCVKSCSRNALNQSEENGVILVNNARCDRCGWCVQACPYGGIAIHPDKNSVLVCDLCNGKPQCIEFCPEEALELVSSDEAANMKLATIMEKLPAEIEKLTNLVKGKAWDVLLSDAERRAKRLSAKLEAINKKWGYK